MLEVGELRPPLPQQPRQRPCHPQLLRPRRECDGLDPVRHELGVPRHGREREVGRDRRQMPEEVQNVGLVPGAVATEDVGVDQDHATSS